MTDAFKFWINPKKYYKENPAKLTKWAKQVYKKDKYTCLKCGYKAGGDLKLEAHHIYPKAIYPRKAYDVSNGATLCEVCHRTGKHSYHALNGNKGNRKMFNKWLTDVKLDFMFLGLVVVAIVVVAIIVILKG